MNYAAEMDEIVGHLDALDARIDHLVENLPRDGRSIVFEYEVRFFLDTASDRG